MTAAPTTPEVPAARRLRVAVLANACSGAGRAAELARAAIEALDTHGHERAGPDCQAVGFVDQLAALGDGGYDVVLAIGGDGTVSAAAGVAVASGAALAIVPAGTMNLVATELGVGDDAAFTVAHLGSMRELRIDCASVNGRVFMHSALLGVVPRMARARERVRSGATAGERARAAVSWARRAVRSRPLHVEIESDAGRDVRRTRSLAVTNNPLAAGGSFSFRRASLTGGVLGVYASAHRGPWGWLRLMVSIGTGSMARDPETLSAGCRELTVRTKTGTVSVAADGEVARLASPLEFRVHPGALRVLVPPGSAMGAGA